MTTDPADLTALPMREWTLVPGSVGSLTVQPMTDGPGGPIDHYVLAAPTRQFPVWRAWVAPDSRLHVLSPLEPPMGRWIEVGIPLAQHTVEAGRRWLTLNAPDGGLSR